MKTNPVGNIIKIHSDFHYVKIGDDIFECKLREKLKKEKLEIFVGDIVKLEEINLNTMQAAIIQIFERKNFIPRPSIANIDQVIITASLKNPMLDLMQLNRYIAHAQRYEIPAVICINKSDLDKNNVIKEEIKKIYEPINYQIIFTSALNGEGIDDLLSIMDNKISVLCGTSGVGKSSLLNMISPGLNLRTNVVSNKSNRGTHTTRHVELIDLSVDNKTITVADTPGFSHLKFNDILPKEIGDLFPEIKELSIKCYFKDCLHIHESNCNVLNNMNKINKSRYNSYLAFVNEAVDFKQKLINSGHKNEKKFKTIDSSNKEKVKIIKLGVQSKEKSRKTHKQNLNSILISNDAYYNEEDHFD